VDHKLLLSYTHRDTFGGVLPPARLPYDRPPVEAGGAQGSLLPSQLEPGNSPPSPLVPFTLGPPGTGLLAGHNPRLIVRVPPPALENAPTCPTDKKPPAGGRGGSPDNTLHPWAISDAHDQLPPCVSYPRPPAPVLDGQHLFRPKEHDNRETPRGVGLPFPDPGVIPTSPPTTTEAFHGLGQVRCREDSPDESREKLPGRPPDLEVPRCRYLLPPLRFGA